MFVSDDNLAFRGVAKVLSFGGCRDYVLPTDLIMRSSKTSQGPALGPMVGFRGKAPPEGAGAKPPETLRFKHISG